MLKLHSSTLECQYYPNYYYKINYWITLSHISYILYKFGIEKNSNVQNIITTIQVCLRTSRWCCKAAYGLLRHLADVTTVPLCSEYWSLLCRDLLWLSVVFS